MSLWKMTDEEASKPKYLSDTLRNDQSVSDLDSTIGVDISEATDASSIAKGLGTPGWVKYTTYTDQHGNTRNKSEVLVAAGSMSSDGTATLDNDLGLSAQLTEAGPFAKTTDYMFSKKSGDTYVIAFMSFSGALYDLVSAGALTTGTLIDADNGRYVVRLTSDMVYAAGAGEAATFEVVSGTVDEVTADTITIQYPA